MKPSIAVDITSRDRTGSGFRSAERGAQGFARRTSALTRDSGLAKLGKQVEGLSKIRTLSFGFDSGLAKLGKQVEGLSKIRTLSFGFDSAGRSLSAIGQGAAGVAGAFGQATERLLLFGTAGTGVLGTVARAAGVTVGAVTGVTAATIGLGVAGYMLGEKWAKVGSEVGRTARTLGVTTAFLQSSRAAGERFGVTADDMTSSIEGLGATLHDARFGGNNLALGVMKQLGIQLKTTKDGAIDTEAAMADLADAIARQKDPQVQRKIAQIFGVSSALPALRQGSAALRAEGADFLGSGSAFTEAEVAKATEASRKAMRFRQHLVGKMPLGKREGVAAMGLTSSAADFGVTAMQDPGDAAKRAADAASGFAGAVDNLLREPLGNIRRGIARRLGADVTPAERAAAMTAFLQKHGFTAEQARGMTAGAHAESLLDPDAVNPKSGAFGIGQWLGPRKRALFRRYGHEPSFQEQLDFMVWELRNTEARAAAAIRRAPDAKGALDAYVRRFMRPAAGEETVGDLRRGAEFLARQPAQAASVALVGSRGEDELRDDGGAASRRPPVEAEPAAEAPRSFGAVPSRGERPPERLAAAPASAEAPSPAPARAQVEIVLRNAPAGTVARVAAQRGVEVDMRVARSLDGP